MKFIKINRKTYVKLDKICAIYTTNGICNDYNLNIMFPGENNSIRTFYKTEEEALDKMDEIIGKFDEDNTDFDVLHL